MSAVVIFRPESLSSDSPDLTFMPAASGSRFGVGWEKGREEKRGEWKGHICILLYHKRNNYLYIYIVIKINKLNI